MNAPIDLPAETALTLTHPLWPLLFPAELASHHGLIAHKLMLAITADIDLGADLNALLAKDEQWLRSCVDALPLSACSTKSDPRSLAQHDADALALRQQLKKQGMLSRCYFVDCVLAELQHGKTLNSKLFAVFKKLTLLSAIALTRINLAEGITQDSTIDAALRNVRLAADHRRGRLLVFLSSVNMQAPLEVLIATLDERFAGLDLDKNKSLSYQVVDLLRLLERLEELRIKTHRGGGGAHRPLERQRLEFTSLTLADDHYRITKLAAVKSHQGRRQLSDEEIETQRDQLVDKETLIITQCLSPDEHEATSGDEPARPVLMDWQARALQSRSVGLAFEIRSQMLPCDPGCANSRHITTLAETLCRPGSKTPAQRALLAMLVLGLDWDAITSLPIWTQPPAHVPQSGETFNGSHRQYHHTGIWCHPTQFALQREHQVANSRVHDDLSILLPDVHFYLLLPLPEILRPLIDGQRLLPCSHELIAQELQTLCKRHKLPLTRAQVSRYFSQWLKRQQVNEAISGLLRGKTAQQCAQLAYSHLDRARVLTVWRDYLGHLSLEIPHDAAAESGQLGSRLMPDHQKLHTLLASYHAYLARSDITQLRRQQDPRYHNLLVRHTLLLLNLATGARPVSDMYDMRNSYDPLMGMIRLVDKEGRNCSAARLVPLAPQALCQLQTLMVHLTLLARRTEPMLQQAAMAAHEALDSQHPMLFWLEYHQDELIGPQWQVQRITVQSMQDKLDGLLPLPANWHRHALCSALIAREVPTWAINALLGHEEMGQEWGHPCSSADLNSLRNLAPVLGTWLDELGIVPLPGWGSS